MKLDLMWFGRNSDYSQDYSTVYKKSITGNNAKDCMKQLMELRYNHDISRYTPIELIFIYD